jgi:hypothetical protein
MNSLLCTSAGKISRSYDLAPYLGLGKQVTMDLDASPWGIGGYLTEDGTIVSWFSSSLSAAELAALGIALGDCAAQQTVEALAALVALRSWSQRWIGLQPTIRVRSDSVSALTIVLKLKTRGKGPGIIARDMALDIAEGCYQPLIAEHGSEYRGLSSKRRRAPLWFPLGIAQVAARGTPIAFLVGIFSFSRKVVFTS